MQNAAARFLLFLLMTMTLTACSVIGGVFKAGIAVGVLVVIIIVVLLFMLFGRRR
jgi:hypothetical protein